MAQKGRTELRRGCRERSRVFGNDGLHNELSLDSIQFGRTAKLLSMQRVQERLLHTRFGWQVKRTKQIEIPFFFERNT